VTAWPDFDRLDPFYRDLAAAIVDVDELRRALSRIGWAADRVRELMREYRPKLRGAVPETARKHRKQAFARMADVVREVEGELDRVGDARESLRELPDVRPDEPTVVVAGYPNVGKSSFVNGVTRASNEIASYPFTTRGVRLGHFERDRIRYQIVDTPGLLDRPADERNDVERRAASALEHLADAVVVLVDASEACGYPIDDQLALRDDIVGRFGARGVPVFTVCNKSDRSRDVEADAYMSVETGEGVEEVLGMAVDAIEVDTGLPPSRSTE